jgi:hypothetical protein
MSAVLPDLQHLSELAFQLSPGDQLRLVVRIGENLTDAMLAQEANGMASGSSPTILRAVREPPHLSDEDVDELELAIVASREPMRAEGVFDGTGDA